MDQTRDELLGQLVAERAARVYARLVFLIRDAHAAEDLLQEALLVVYRRMPETADAQGAARYLDEVVRRLVRHHLSSGGGNRAASVDPGLLDRMEAADAAESGRSARREALADCLDLLPGELKELVDLHYHQGLVAREVAARTGQGLSAVLVALHRVRIRLRDCARRKLQSRGILDA